MKFRLLTALALVAWATCAHAVIINFTGSVSSSTFSEKGSNQVTVTVTFQSDADIGTAVALTIAPQGQGPQYATYGSDYTCPSTASAAFQGLVNGLRSYKATFVVAAVDDNLIENGELINLLVYPQSGSSGAQYYAQLMLGDASPRPTVTLSTNNLNPTQSTDIYESSLIPTQFILTRTVRTDVRSVVGIELSGTATNGVDYQRIATQVVFNYGDTVKKVTINPIDDDIYDPDEVVQIRLTASTNYNVAPQGGGDGGSVTMSAKIVDDEIDTTPTPTPIPEPTPDVRQQIQNQPVRVIGMYPAAKALFSGDGYGLAIAHGPVISIHDAGSFWKGSDIVNTRYVPEGVVDEETGETSFYEQASVLDMGWSNDRGLLVTTFNDKGLLWDVWNRKPLLSYEHGEDVKKIVYFDGGSADILQSKVALANTWVSVWQVWTGAILTQINPEGTISTLKFSYDGHLLFVATSDTLEGQLWDLETNTKLHTFSFDGIGAVNAASFSQDGHYLILGHTSNRISVVNLGTYATDYRIQTTAPVVFVEVDPSGETFAANYGDTIRFWRLDNFQPTSTVLTGFANPGQVSFSPDRTKLTGTDGGSVFVYDVDNDEELWRLSPYPLERFTQLGTGGNLLFANTYAPMQVWNYHTGIKMADLPMWDNTDTSPAQRLQDFAANKSGTNLALLTKDDVSTDMIQMYSLATNSLVSTGALVNDRATCIELADSQLRTFVGGLEDTIFITAFDSETSGAALVTTYSQEVTSFDSALTGNILDLQLADNETQLASISDLEKLSIHKTNTGALESLYENDLFVTSQLDQVLISQDGKLAAAVNDSSVVLWDTTTDRLESIYTGGRVRAAIAPNKKWMVATKFENGNTVLFRPGATIGYTTEYMGVFGVTDPLRDYEFTPASDRFMTLGGEINGYNTIWLWDVAFASTAAQPDWAIYE